MASIPPPEKAELLHFSYVFLQVLLNTLSVDQIDKILMQEDVIEKLPGHLYQPKTVTQIYLQCVKEQKL